MCSQFLGKLLFLWGGGGLFVVGRFPEKMGVFVKGQFHGKVDMTLKFQVYHIAKKLLIMFYPYAEVKETKIIL